MTVWEAFVKNIKQNRQPSGCLFAFVSRTAYSLTNFLIIGRPSSPFSNLHLILTKYMPAVRFSTSHATLSLQRSKWETICPVMFTISIEEIVSDDVMNRVLLVGFG